MLRLLLSGLVVALVAGIGFAEEGQKPKKADAPTPNVIILKIDASTLPPDLLKKLIDIQAAQPKPAAEKPAEKPAAKAGAIGLSEAIARAEKVSGGQAVKAEKKTEGEVTTFTIELVNKSGEKTKVVLDASGKAPGEKQPDPKPEVKPEVKPTPKPEVKPGEGVKPKN